MDGAKSYHHKDLRSTLLQAAEAELIDKGLEHFSLRGIARRAGVSHAAPAHYFQDVDSLVTALGALAFGRFRDVLAAAVAGEDPAEDLVAIGLAYIRYAEAQPDIFNLQFISDRPNREDPDFKGSANACFAVMRGRVEAFACQNSWNAEEAEDLAATLWATTHGLATLFAINRRRAFAQMSDAERYQTFARILRRLVQPKQTVSPLKSC
ncbi:MAG: TetR/AcrR family transcriptional regulator [Pseudomonadota bacterium]